MARVLLALLALLLLFPAPGWSQRSLPTPAEEKGTYLGILFKSIPEAAVADTVSAPPKQGVLVTHVFPKSPATEAGLQRDDILTQYNSEKIRDCEHLARLIGTDKPNNKVKLTYLRDGKEMTAEAVLTLGLALQPAAQTTAAAKETELARAKAKVSGPPSISVWAAPQANGNLDLTIEYYQESTGRFQKVTCSGTPAQIDREIQKLPTNIQELTRIALKRINALELNKATPSRSSQQR